MKRTRSLVLGAVVVAIGSVSLALAQNRGGPPAGASPDMGRQLIEGLKATPGCLGVDAGQMMSGKNTIFAWFENKAAVKRWYYSDVHQSMIQGLSDGTDRRPMEHVKDEKTPILVTATITFSDKPHFKEVELPVSLIAIELYAPLPGGAYLGGRLAPDTFEVPHMRGYTPEPEAAGAAAGSGAAGG